MILKEILKNSGISEERDLMPGLSYKEDNSLRRNLKILFLLKDPEFESILYRINLSRKANGLPELYKQEIMSSSLKQDIKKGMKNEKETISKAKNELSQKKNLSKLKMVSKWGFYISDFSKDSKGLKLTVGDDNLFNQLVLLDEKVDKIHILSILEYNDMKFLIVCVEPKSVDRYQLEVLGNAPLYKIIGLEVRFPELERRIICRPHNPDRHWIIKRL